MEMDQTPAPLAQFIVGLFQEGLREERRLDRRIEVLCSEAQRLMTSTPPSTRAKAMDMIKTVVAQVERSQTNSSNRAKGGGRSPSEARERLPGIDAVDAGVMLEICRRLGVLNKARLLAFMARDAITAERAPLVAAGAKPLNNRDWAKLLDERERKLKSLFEDPPAKLRRTIAERAFDLPNDQKGLKEALRAISVRLWPAEA